MDETQLKQVVEGFDAAMIWGIATLGMEEKDFSFYGGGTYRSPDTKPVKLEQVFFEKSRWEEDSWERFAGTFAENERVRGLKAYVTLRSGKARIFMYEGPIGDLIKAVVNFTAAA